MCDGSEVGREEYAFEVVVGEPGSVKTAVV